MKVIHYISSLRFGGIERLVYDLVSQQIKKSHLEVDIGVGKLDGEFKEQFYKLAVKLINTKLSSGFDINPYKVWKISKIFKKYDIIHLHGFNLAIIIAAVFCGKKIIYTEHGNFGFGRHIKKTDKLSFFLRKLFFRYTNVSICCNSNFTKNYVKGKFYNGTRLKVIYNGSNLENVLNEKLKLRLQNKYQDKFIIGTSSRLAGVKRVNRLIYVFSKYLKFNPKSVLVIVGDGVERDNLEEQVAELKIQEYVFFEGYQKDVATYQSIFDICVFASLNESFGLVAVECYSKKKPVIVFKDGGGLTEIVDRFVSEDICDNYDKMQERFKYYEKQIFEWNTKFNDQLKFFSLERMETDYYNEYKKVLKNKINVWD